MLRTIILYQIFLLLSGGAFQPSAKESIPSPDGNLEVLFWVNDEHQPVYSILYHGRQVLEPSQLGLVRDGIDFSKSMSLETSSEVKPVSDQYQMMHGKQQDISYRANEKTFRLAHESNQPLNIIFRVSNNGVAFQYQFPGKDEQMHKITDEKTSFNLPDESRAWLEPLANVNTGWAQTNPSYEEHYVKNVKVGTSAPDSAGWAYPAMFKSGDTWLLISETGMDGTYCGTRLQQESLYGNYKVGFPEAGEVYPGGPLKPQSNLPWESPWRLIAVGDLTSVTESTLGTDLADPAVEMDTSWIKPGRASWSWAKLKDQSITYDVQKRFVDYASKMGWEYTLVDVNWDSTIGYQRIADLADYAATKDVGLILWYNSSGSWNQTQYTPKSKLLTHKDRVNEFSTLHEMGIKGIKVDFFSGDGQSMMQYYRDIFKDAADYQLLVNTHGTTLPRGWHRTWPNLMAMESVKGFEFITFEQINADREAGHAAMLPFTRNVFSPMDFTPMSLTPLFNVERKTTNGFELALPVLFTSGIQHYAETARGMEEVPAFTQDFIKQIPVRWDEMQFIDGFPGKLAVIARRSGDQWFVGGINGENQPKEITADLSFLPDGALGTMIYDGKDKFQLKQKNVVLPESKKMKISLKKNGGFVILFKEINQ